MRVEEIAEGGPEEEEQGEGERFLEEEDMEGLGEGQAKPRDFDYILDEIVGGSGKWQWTR